MLRHSPHSLAFVISGAKSDSGSEASTDFGEEQRRKKVQTWLDLLESDLGVKVIAELPDAGETGPEGSSETEPRPCMEEVVSITSHEFGVDLDADDEPDLSDEQAAEEDDDGPTDAPEKKECFPYVDEGEVEDGHSGELATASLRASPTPTWTASTMKGSSGFEPQIPAVRQRQKPGPWRIVEIFSWTMAVSFAAHQRGWQVGEPLTVPGFDLLKTTDQAAAEAYIREFDPDLQTFGFKTQEKT